jgi:hypothetical protein
MSNGPCIGVLRSQPRPVLVRAGGRRAKRLPRPRRAICITNQFLNAAARLYRADPETRETLLQEKRPSHEPPAHCPALLTWCMLGTDG